MRLFKNIILLLFLTVFTACTGSKNLSEADLNSIESSVEYVDSDTSHYLLTLSGFTDIEDIKYKASINRLSQLSDDVLEVIEVKENARTLSAKINDYPLSLNRVLWALGPEHHRDHSVEHKWDTPAGGMVNAPDMPELIGDINNLQKSVRYPSELKGSGANSRVEVGFVINEYGEVVDPVVINSFHSLAESEALRVVENVKYKPGMREGVPIKVRMVIPIMFRE